MRQLILKKSRRKDRDVKQKVTKAKDKLQQKVFERINKYNRITITT